MTDDSFDDTPPPSNSALPVAVLFLAALIGSGVGVLIGYTTWGTKPPPPPEKIEVEVLRDYTPEELQIACLPLMRQTATTLEEAETQVEALAVQVREKEAQVAALEKKVRAERGAKSVARNELAQAKKELETLQQALTDAETAYTELEKELKQTKAALSSTKTKLVSEKARTQRAEEDSVAQRWTGFVTDSLLTVCEKGTKGRIEKCREAVAAAVAPHQRRYLSCVRSGDTIPSLRFNDKLESLPSDAIWLDDSNKLIKGWYIEFCDPALPEAGGRPSTAPPPGGDLLDDE